MQIQTLSIVVPAPCLNRCKFCVAHMREDADQQEYINQIEKNRRFHRLYKEDYKKRMLFARDNGCNTIILTGNGEPLLNPNFIEDIAEWNTNLPIPFRWLELQTSGTKLDDEMLRFLRDDVGVNTISLSLSDMFSSDINAKYNVTKKGFEVDIDKVCSEIKRYDFNLRLSLNLTDVYNDKTPIEVFNRASQLGADQITFRVLYKSGEETPQDRWIEEHSIQHETFINIKRYVVNYATPLEILPFGAIKYSLNGIGVVIDSDCMSKELKDTFKYLILRPNCKLYSRWDDKGSLVF